MLDEIGELSARRQALLPFGKDEDSRKGRERAICRLLRLGVIRDYEVEYGRRQFAIHVEKFDAERCRGALLEYVCAAQPAKGRLFARRAAEIDSGSPRDAVFAFARMLIEFTYDVVERSPPADDPGIRTGLLVSPGPTRTFAYDCSTICRRAWAQNASNSFLAAKRSTSLPGGSLWTRFRRRWTRASFAACASCAGVLPGPSGTAAGPRDGGIDVLRITTMPSARRGSGLSIRTSIAKYELAQPEVETIIDSLFDLALTRAPDLGRPLTFALLALDDAAPDGERRNFAFALEDGTGQGT